MPRIDYSHASVFDKLLRDEIQPPKNMLGRQLGVREQKIAKIYRSLKKHYLLNEKEIQAVTKMTKIDPFLLQLILVKKEKQDENFVGFFRLLCSEIERREKFNKRPWYRRLKEKKQTRDLIDFKEYFESDMLHLQKIKIGHCHDAYLDALNKKIEKTNRKPFYIRGFKSNIVDLKNIREMLVFHRDSRRDLKNPKERLVSGEPRDPSLTEKLFIKKIYKRTTFFGFRRRQTKNLYRSHIKKCRKTEKQLYKANLNMENLINNVYEGAFLHDPLQKSSAVIQFEVFRGKIHEGLFSSLNIEGFPKFLSNKIKIINGYIEIFDKLSQIKNGESFLDKDAVKKWSLFLQNNGNNLDLIEKNNAILNYFNKEDEQGLINSLYNSLACLNYNKIFPQEPKEGYFDNHDAWMEFSLEELFKQHHVLGKITPKRAAVNYALLTVSEYKRDIVANNLINAMSNYYLANLQGNRLYYFTQFNEIKFENHQHRHTYLLNAVDLLKAGKIKIACDLQSFMTVGKDYKKNDERSMSQSLGQALRFLNDQQKLLLESVNEYRAVISVFVKAMDVSEKKYTKDLKALADLFKIQTKNIIDLPEEQGCAAFRKALQISEKNICLGNDDDFKLDIDGLEHLKPINKKFLNDHIQKFLMDYKDLVTLVYGNYGFSERLNIAEKTSAMKKRYQNNLTWANGIVLGAKSTVQAAKFITGQVTEGFNLGRV